jgi:hypothetical protein
VTVKLTNLEREVQGVPCDLTIGVTFTPDGSRAEVNLLIQGARNHAPFTDPFSFLSLLLDGISRPAAAYRTAPTSARNGVSVGNHQ